MTVIEETPWTPIEALSAWDKKYLCKALFVSNWSKDPSTKVGCVLTARDHRPISDGYNGLPKLIRGVEEARLPQDLKRLMTIHAELNALLFAKEIPGGTKAYITQPPCAGCMAALLQRGISDITYLDSSTGKGNLSEHWAASLRAANILSSNYYPLDPRSVRSIRRVDRDAIRVLYNEMVKLPEDD